MANKKKLIVISSVVVVLVAGVASAISLSSSTKKIPIAIKDIEEPNIEGKYSTFLNHNKQLLSNQSLRQEYLANDFNNVEVYHFHNEDNLNCAYLKEDEKLSLNVNVETKGLYQFNLSYYLLSGEYGSNEISISINGKVQYDESFQISLEEKWQDKGEVTKDRYGNDNLPEQEKYQGLISYTLKDSSRLYDQGLYFLLEQGQNIIEINSIQGDLDLAKFSLIRGSELVSYDNYYHNEQIVQEPIIETEAEKYVSKNSSNIQAGTSNDSAVTPYSLNRNRLNIMGSGNYNEPGDRVDYKINVNKTGYYYLTFKVLQTEKNTTSYRSLLVNGKVPFKEALNIPFSYSDKWQNVTVGSLSGNPYAIYLEQGENTISLEVNSSLMRIVSEKLKKLSTEINELGLQVTRITGNSTDKEIDWDMVEYFTDINEMFDRWIKELKEIIDYLNNAFGFEGKSYITSDLNSALSNLITISNDINKLPNRLTLLSNGSSCAAQFISGQIANVLNSNLTIDKFYIHSKDAKLPSPKASAIKNTWNKTKKLFNSFFDENYKLDKKSNAVKVWVARSRQYCNVLQKLVDNDFTSKTGIKVDIELLTSESKILLANAANQQPDVATGISTWIPNEYGMRGAVYDLTNFDDFGSAIKDYNNEQLIPLIYDDHLYGIPETENFYVLFYRKDILKSLSLDVPNTWNDVIDMLPVLERYGMQFYIPLSSPSSSKSYDMTAPFIWQNGGVIFHEDTLTSGIDNENSIQGLQFMTNLYREYSLPYQISNFFNYFRYGDMPIGIADYGTYLQLLNAAPEISGLWEISVVPGTQKDGTINRYMSGAQQSSMIFEKSDKKEQAWEFVKWWSSKDTQLAYSQMMINTYGKRYMWNTANQEAFKELPWDKEDKQVILEQWSYLKEVAKAPGSYIIEREISNIYNSVVFNDVNLRSTVSDSVIKMNKEIRRKMVEFGYMDDYGNIIKQYHYPNSETIQNWRNS